jgi:2-oxoglutarate ferredoxin oxidoreductase subunit beta
MLRAGATFISRSYSNRMENLVMMIDEAMKHKGFSFVEVLQPCYTYYNTYKIYNKRVYELGEEPPKEQVINKMTEWNYGSEGNIPIGIFYRETRPTYEESMLREMVPAKRREEIDIEDFLKGNV